MNTLVAVGLGWLGFNVLVVLLAWVFRGHDDLDVHEILDRTRR